MSAIRYNVKTCTKMLGCDGERTTARDGVCQACKDREARLLRSKREYARISKLVAEAERNGRRFAQGAR